MSEPMTGNADADRIHAWIREVTELEGRFRTGDADAADALRRLAAAISSESATAHLPGLEESADAVVVAGAEHLQAATKLLLEELEAQLNRSRTGRQVVAVCGVPRELAEELRRRLQAEGLRGLVAANLEEVFSLAASEDLAVVVLALGASGHGAVRAASERLEQLGVPMLVVGPQRAIHELDQSCLGPADGMMPLEAGVQGVLPWVLKHRYGIQETIRSVRRDRVTGLMNRVAFLERLADIQQVSRRTGEPVSVAVVDLTLSEGTLAELDDHTYVEVLMRVASGCSRTFRETDVIARIGGARFAVVFPGELPEGCERALQRLLDHIEQGPISFGEVQLSLSAKAGVAPLAGVMTPESVLEEAATLLREISGSGDARIGRWSASPAEGGRIVLLAQSKSPTAGILNRLLSQEGYDVLQAERVDGLLEVTEDEAVSLAIVDEELGVEQAEQCVAALRKEPSAAHCPVVLLGQRDGDAAARAAACASLGLIDYMSRPFTVAQFLKRIRQLLGGQGSGEDDAAGRDCRVLLVDSHIGRLLLAANALQRTGAFEILLSRSSADAITRCRNERPGALFMVMDGGATGRELADWLLQEGRLSEMRVVVAADSRSIRLADKVRYAGGAGVLELPYDAQQLPQKLAESFGVDLSAEERGTQVPLDAEIKRVMSAG